MPTPMHDEDNDIEAEKREILACKRWLRRAHRRVLQNVMRGIVRDAAASARGERRRQPDATVQTMTMLREELAMQVEIEAALAEYEMMRSAMAEAKPPRRRGNGASGGDLEKSPLTNSAK